MFLLESAALPGENDFCAPWPSLSPRSVGVRGRVAERVGITIPLFQHYG